MARRTLNKNKSKLEEVQVYVLNYFVTATLVRGVDGAPFLFQKNKTKN